MRPIATLFSGISLFVLLCACKATSGIDPKDEIVRVAPSNLVLEVIPKGATPENPTGDGSGEVTCKLTAKDAVRYSFRFGTGEVIENRTGEATYTFLERGTRQYTITAVAYSEGGLSASASKEIMLKVEPNYVLVWADEFNSGVAPDASKWNYDIGTGSNGWGNNESQFYTNRPTNVSISDGILRITARKEAFSGSAYTSTRMKTQDKYSFTYGRVEVRAKLPTGKGTWPAIWMLGNNIPTVGWPACGEIDIMEHVGNQQDMVHNSIHTPSSFGNTQNTSKRTVEGVSEEFHIYSMEWTKESIVFMIDNQPTYTYKPSAKTPSTWPFDAPQFIILNVAMGGGFGGAIDPAFVSSTMEIDYVRVYQVK